MIWRRANPTFPTRRVEWSFFVSFFSNAHEPDVERSGTTRVNWTAVVFFYAIACAISWPAFWLAFVKKWEGPFHVPLLRTSCYMWGPGLAAIAAFWAFRRSHRRTITFTGDRAGLSLAFYAVPFLLLAVVHTPDRGLAAWKTVALIATAGFFNILGEELGWRGFLQDALRPIPRWWRYVILGVMWEFWHFRFGVALFNGRDFGPLILFEGMITCIVIILSIILGEATDRSRSLVVAVTLHFWLDLLIEAPAALNVTPYRTYLVAAGSVLFWGWLLRKWCPKKATMSDLAIQSTTQSTQRTQ
jgi:uncharacterized protein